MKVLDHYTDVHCTTVVINLQMCMDFVYFVRIKKDSFTRFLLLPFYRFFRV